MIERSFLIFKSLGTAKIHQKIGWEGVGGILKQRCKAVTTVFLGKGAVGYAIAAGGRGRPRADDADNGDVSWGCLDSSPVVYLKACAANSESD